MATVSLDRSNKKKVMAFTVPYHCLSVSDVEKNRGAGNSDIDEWVA
jgi:hypothetical protein